MIPETATLNYWASDWSALMVAMLWQSTLLAAVVALVAWLIRRSSPAVRYWLWQIMAIKLLVMPLWTQQVPVSWLEDAAPRSAMDAEETTLVGSPQQQDGLPSDKSDTFITDSPDNSAKRGNIASAGIQHSSMPMSWAAWLMLAWAAVVVGQFGMLLWQRMRLGQVLRRAHPAGTLLESEVAQCAARLGLRQPPRVLVTELDCSPFVFGIWRSTMILPGALQDMVGGGQLAPILTHELAHLQRRDLLWNWLPQIARMVYFFHPVAHWVSFRARLEAEVACDAAAMAATGHAPASYADLLVRVLSHLSEPAMLRSVGAASARLDGHQATLSHFNDSRRQASGGRES